MRYAILIVIQLFMGMTMANGQNEELINEILQLREKIESIAMDETLTNERKMFLIYRLMPTTKEKHSILYTGDYKQLLDKEDGIGTWTKKLDSTPLRRLINEAPKYVPPYLIIEKFSDIIRDNPLDVEAIINSINFEGDRPEWPGFGYYMDSKLLPPEPGGEYDSLEEHEQKRADEFQRLLKQESGYFIIRFMLLAALSPEGEYSRVPLNDYEKMWDGEAFAYAEGNLYDSFPVWYQQWNKLVPTMCVRIGQIADQKLCPDPRNE